MKESEYKKGMLVRVSTDITKTDRRYSADAVMRNMRGKVFNIEGLSLLKKGAYIRYKDRRYLFVIEDLTAVKLKPKPSKPILFDPKYLDV